MTEYHYFKELPRPSEANDDYYYAICFAASEIYKYFRDINTQWTILERSPADANWEDGITLFNASRSASMYPWFVVEANQAWPLTSPPVKQQFMLVFGNGETYYTSFKTISLGNDFASYAVIYAPLGGYNPATQDFDSGYPTYRRRVSFSGTYMTMEGLTSLYIGFPSYILINGDESTFVMIHCHANPDYDGDRGIRGMYLGAFNKVLPSTVYPVQALCFISAATTVTLSGYSSDETWARQNHYSQTVSPNYIYIINPNLTPQYTDTMYGQISAIFNDCPGYSVNSSRAQDQESMLELPLNIVSIPIHGSEYAVNDASYLIGSMKFVKLTGKYSTDTATTKVGFYGMGRTNVNLTQDRIVIGGFSYNLAE